ncbi:MAG TPA: RagB/SusD family nutrient uptake outer membrane protein [Bacteroidales bacterium]|nr:RagB/SusD family nutrient uptake outer membrane protein [Bacteroidales bacterium]
MKKYAIIILTVLLASACEKQLNLEPKGSQNYDNYYKTKAEAIAAINAIYDVLGYVNLYSSNLWLIQDIGSDDCFLNEDLPDPNLRQIDQYDIQTNNNYLKGIWQDSYVGIHRANVAILKIPPIDMDETLKNRLLGEAKFLRSLFYFNLVRLFGDVPLVTVPSSTLSDYKVARTSADTIYAKLIIPGFRDASESLPPSYSGPDKGRATEGAALGMLSEVYLTRHQWNRAAQYGKEVMDLDVYGLWDDYADNFKEANYNGKESVFEVQFNGEVPAEDSRIVISGLPSIGAFPAGVEIMLPTEDLLNTFEEGDYRKDVTFFDSYNYFGTQTFYPHIWKHWDQSAYPARETGNTGADFMVMRYAQVLLMYAEALNEANGGPTTEAYDAINQVRARARNGNPGVLPDLSGLNQDEFRTAVYKEKRCETVNEGQRWYDLVRTGRLVERVNAAKGAKATPESFNTLFPVPQHERDVDPNLTQNEGY